MTNSNILRIVCNDDMKVCEASGLAETRVLRSVLDTCWTLMEVWIIDELSSNLPLILWCCFLRHSQSFSNDQTRILSTLFIGLRYLKESTILCFRRCKSVRAHVRKAPISDHFSSLCARVFPPAATILKSKKTLGMRLTFSLMKG